MKAEPLEVRMWRKFQVNQETGCWDWTASRTPAGTRGGRTFLSYGQVWDPERGSRGTMVQAHRAMWKVVHGEYPHGVVRHRCDNPCCVNPAHLELGTQRDNVRDTRERGRANPRKGAANGRATLSERDVRAVRELYALGWGSQSDFGRALGVGQSTISRVLRGESWAHVKPTDPPQPGDDDLPPSDWNGDVPDLPPENE